MGPTNTVKVKLLGGFSAALSSELPIKLAGKKNGALLAYLAIGRGKRHVREKLMALLWGDRREAQARGSLRQALSALKEALAAAPGALVLEGDSVTLDPGVVVTGVARRAYQSNVGATSASGLRCGPGIGTSGVTDELRRPRIQGCARQWSGHFPAARVPGCQRSAPTEARERRSYEIIAYF